MPGIPPELKKRLRETLARCGPFDSNETLTAAFTDDRIYPWRGCVPDRYAAHLTAIQEHHP
jgi:hypothetical protein